MSLQEPTRSELAEAVQRSQWGNENVCPFCLEAWRDQYDAGEPPEYATDHTYGHDADCIVVRLGAATYPDVPWLPPMLGPDEDPLRRAERLQEQRLAAYLRAEASPATRPPMRWGPDSGR